MAPNRKRGVPFSDGDITLIPKAYNNVKFYYQPFILQADSQKLN